MRLNGYIGGEFYSASTVFDETSYNHEYHQKAQHKTGAALEVLLALKKWSMRWPFDDRDFQTPGLGVRSHSNKHYATTRSKVQLYIKREFIGSSISIMGSLVVLCDQIRGINFKCSNQRSIDN